MTTPHIRVLLSILTFGAAACSAGAQGRGSPPAQLTGGWQCMRSVVTGDPYQRMFTFDVRSGGVWIDRTTRAAVQGRYSYNSSTGVLRLSSARGTLLYTLRWEPATATSRERLVEQVAERTRAGEVCYRAGGAAASVPRPQAPAPAGDRAVSRGDPFNIFSYPAHISVTASTDGLPQDAVLVFTLTPLNGGNVLTMRRTVRQLYTSPSPVHRVPVDETATLLLPRPGRYRVEVAAEVPARGRIPLVMGYDREASVVLEWGPNDTYLNGGRSLMVFQP